MDAEIDIVRRLREGDPAAFDAVHAMYNVRLFSFLVRLSRSRERAEDLLEETWLRLVTHADRLRPDTRLGPWLYTVARNLHTSHCRSRMLEELHLESGLALWPTALPSSPFEETAASELERRVEVVLASLPLSYREVLLLVAVEGLDPAEAAEVCGIRPAALRQRLKRARDLVEKRLNASARPELAALGEVMP
jgi:RNA polymerase sigma factor (sigma-70 family)